MCQKDLIMTNHAIWFMVTCSGHHKMYQIFLSNNFPFLFYRNCHLLSLFPILKLLGLILKLWTMLYLFIASECWLIFCQFYLELSKGFSEGISINQMKTFYTRKLGLKSFSAIDWWDTGVLDWFYFQKSAYKCQLF